MSEIYTLESKKEWEREGRPTIEDLQLGCPRCNGFIKPETCYDHGVSTRMYHCLMCGRYYPIGVQTATVDVAMGRLDDNLKPWKRIAPEVIPKVRRLLESGYNPTETARRAGVHVITVRKMIAKFNWDYRSGRPNRRGGAGKCRGAQ